MTIAAIGVAFICVVGVAGVISLRLAIGPEPFAQEAEHEAERRADALIWESDPSLARSLGLPKR